MLPNTIEIDTTKHDEVMHDLGEALAGQGQDSDARNIVRDETRRLIVQIVKFIPPQTKQIGINAMCGDLNALFSGADPGFISNMVAEHGPYNIDTYLTTKTGAKLRLRWHFADPIGANLAGYHDRARNSKGRITRGKDSRAGEWNSRIVVPKESKAAYVEKEYKKVGRAKAAWAQTAMALGVQNVVGWIRRHIPNPKAVSDTTGLLSGSFPVVTFGSRSPGIRRQAGDIRDAVRARTEAIKKRIRLVVSGYDKDIARGIRIQSAAKRSGQGGSYAIG